MITSSMIRNTLIYQAESWESQFGRRFPKEAALYFISVRYPDAKISDVLDVIDSLVLEKILYED